MAYQNYLDALSQNQTSAAARGLGYTGVAAGLDQRSNAAYTTQLLNVEAELNKLAQENALSSISNQNTTGSEWLHAMLKQIDTGNTQLTNLSNLFGQGAGQASDYEKVQNQLANALKIAELQAAVDREKMAIDLKIANLNRGSRGGGGGYSGGGYSGGGYSSASTAPAKNVGTMGVWNNATKTIDYIPATKAAYDAHFQTSLAAKKNVRR